MTVHIALSLPDHLGRVHMSTFKYESDGIFRPEMHHDGIPVGFRRGQCFFCPPQPHHGPVADANDVAQTKAWPVTLSDAERASGIEQLTYRLEHTGVSGQARVVVVKALAWLHEMSP